MKEITLTKGKIALVDDIDYAWLNQYKWHASKMRNCWYAEGQKNCGGKQRKVLMHRFILQTPEGIETDHINGNGLDNRRENLRRCTTTQNQQNQFIVRQGTTSNFKGVYWRKDTQNWKAQIVVNRKKLSLGHFTSEIQASLAYDEAANKYFGEFAKTNRELALTR